MSGIWWALQKEKYDELVRRMAPLVSSVAGCGNTPFHQLKKRAGQQLGESGSSPAPWHAETWNNVLVYAQSESRNQKNIGVGLFTLPG